MNVPSPPVLDPNKFENADPNLLSAISRAFEEHYNALAQIPQSGTIKDKPFATPASGNADVEVANPLDTRPKHVQATRVARADGAAITTAYSATWDMHGDNIVVTFIGLPASTKFIFTARVE